MLSRRQVIAGAGAAATPLLFTLDACSNNGITFASPTPVWWNAVPLIAQRHHCYEAEHVTVAEFEVPNGVRSKQAIAEGNADMGVASANAISTSTDSELMRLKILASITQSRSTLAIMSHAGADPLVGRIGYAKGTISEFYLIAYLLKIGKIDLYRQKRLQLINLPPPNLVTAFVRGDIDTAVTWEPFASQISRSFRPPQAVSEIRDEGLYAQHIFALSSTTTDVSKRNAVLKGLKRASDYINQHRTDVASELEHFFKFPPGFLLHSRAWQEVSFSFSTDHQLIVSGLEQDLALAREAGVAKTAGGQSFAHLLD
jgi:ABC-type nitrate/sulfonate/bicarbonate transport system substrate-binding protein